MIYKIFVCFITFFVISSLNTVAFSEPSMVVISNKGNTVTSLSKAELQALFRLDKKYWNDGKKVVLVLPSQESEVSNKFNKSVYNMNSSELKKYWFTKIFSNKISSPPKAFSSDSEIVKFVSSTVGAIGYVAQSSVNSSVKVISVAW